MDNKITRKELQTLPFEFVEKLEDYYGGLGTSQERSSIFRLNEKLYKTTFRRYTEKASKENAIYPSDDVYSLKIDIVDNDYNFVENVYFEENRYNDYK